MATNPQDIAPGADEQHEPNPAQGADDPGGSNQGGNDGGGEQVYEPTPYDDLAKDLGWVPPDKFNGDPAEFKSAEQFLRDGRDIMRQQTKKLSRLESTLDNLSRTNAAVLEQEINRRVTELGAQYQQAVDDGDAAKAFKLSQDIGALQQQGRQAAPQNGPGPDAQEFASRNASWFQKDPLGTALAVDICNRLAAQGYDHATQLAAAEKEVRRVYPHLFGGQMNGAKPQAGVNRPGTRGPIGGGNRPKGFADMPIEAQRVAQDMAERLGIPKERYAENYWKESQRKA